MNGNAEVAVVGSVNADITFQLRSLPLPGETVLSSGRHDAPGGKGANQAAALAALGTPVELIASVGDDNPGLEIISHLQSRGVDCTSVSLSPELPTGSAVILVSSGGENSIVVDAGANGALTPELVNAYFSDHKPAIVLAQLEVSVETILRAAELAPEIFVLNPAPIPPSSPELKRLIGKCDILVPNRSELASLVDCPVPQNTEDVVSTARLLDYSGQLVVTLGADGAVVFPRGVAADYIVVAAPRVESVDSSGAGDAFCAALVTGILNGENLVDACHFACNFASWTTTQIGAQVGDVKFDGDLSHK